MELSPVFRLVFGSAIPPAAFSYIVSDSEEQKQEHMKRNVGGIVASSRPTALRVDVAHNASLSPAQLQVGGVRDCSLI
jgi:hypothetical protein